MDLKLAGRSVVFTGALREIGRTIVRNFAKEGARMAFWIQDHRWVDEYTNDPPKFKSMRDGVPLGRLAEPKEVTRTVVFLVSPVASYIYGVNLAVDGAMVRRIQY